MTGSGAPEEADVKYYVFEVSFRERAGRALGWLLGWYCYWIARCGFTAQANELVDSSIVLFRGNKGAVRTIGYLNSLEGRLAFRRGRILVEGQIGPDGPFANKRFFASYWVAARDERRALELIKRFEWDAIPSSLSIEESDLSSNDDGAEGVMHAAFGRSFYVAED